MSYIAINPAAPHATAYDADYPTRSTENYSHSLHNILQDMEDAVGTWYLHDNTPTTTERDALCTAVRLMIKEVFDYAEGAIDTYRSTGTPTLTEPVVGTITAHSTSWTDWGRICAQTYVDCMKMCYFIYYMWKTEDDPLLLKEKLQELLVAWPLLDTTIELSSELGQQFKVYPSWKNADLDL